MSGKSITTTSPTSSKGNSPNKLEFVVGNRIEAMDYMSQWYVSKIAKVDLKKRKILIHFEGWNSRYDEWVSFDSKKIRPLPKEKMKPKMKGKELKEWKQGDAVSAKWSDGTFYPAKIVSVISKEFYEVEYDDGFQKLIHRGKIRDKERASKVKKPPSVPHLPLHKIKLAEDRAKRARRRSGLDTPIVSPMVSPTTSEPSEESAKIIENIDSQKPTEENHETKLASSPTKPCDVAGVEKSHEIKNTKTKSMKPIESGSQKTSEAITKIDDILLSSDADKMEDSSKHQHSSAKDTKSDQSSTRKSISNVMSPLSVEVDSKTDIHQVIVADEDMKILQSSGVLGLLNVQEPCDIQDKSSVSPRASCTAAEEVLSKCQLPSEVTVNVKKVNKRSTRYKYKEKLVVDEKKMIIDNKNTSPSKVEHRSNDNEDLGKSKLSKVLKHVSKIESDGLLGCSESNNSKITNVDELLGSSESNNTNLKRDDKTDIEEKKSNDFKSQRKLFISDGSVADSSDVTIADKAKGGNSIKDKSPHKDAFKAKKQRLDQITVKLSNQRQTQITAKHEVIKKKLDHLKSEEINNRSAHASPQNYQPVSPNPPTYSHMSAPAHRISPQYMERYPAPAIISYGPPTQCTSPCYTYPPGSGYPPGNSCQYQLGGVPCETYVVYGPGSQPSFPVITSSNSSSQCNCHAYPPPVLHECGQQGSPLVRLMPVDQRALPGSVVYTQTADRRNLSPRDVTSKSMNSYDNQMITRAHNVSNKSEEETGARQVKCIGEVNRVTRKREVLNRPDTLLTPYNKTISSSSSSMDVNLTTHLSAHLTKRKPQHIPSKAPFNVRVDPDDVPLSSLVSPSTTSSHPTKDKTPTESKTLDSKTPVTSPSEGVFLRTPLPPDGYPGKTSKKPHVFAPKELRIELDHNKFKCEYPECDKSFRKASLLESHVKYYHTSAAENRRKRSSASWSEEDIVDSCQQKKRTKRQSTSDISVGSVGDLSMKDQSPVALDIHVEVERDIDDEMEMDISDPKDEEEDVVRCLCGALEDSGLMIQCEQCFTWQHSECVNVGEEQVPTKYLCYVCKNPPGLRKNARYKNNYDWFKTGILPSFALHKQSEVKMVQAQITNCLLSDLHSLNARLKGVKKKIHILKTPGHEDLLMWEHKQYLTGDVSLRIEEDNCKNETDFSEKKFHEDKFSLNNSTSLENGVTTSNMDNSRVHCQVQRNMISNGINGIVDEDGNDFKREDDNDASHDENSTHDVENSKQNGRDATFEVKEVNDPQLDKTMYCSEDLAFINLLEEIQEDHKNIDKQFDNLEEQVEILEKSFKTGSDERRPSIRKLAKQLTKLLNMGLLP
ncbi:PHD finger protein 20-like protein 1 isoform X2 [Xenia sp. Carnegie-2017]|uniref:PHD finger protein 20-like protein 1 isoform X2 n=1 Tax=Xenia sp. Carnegie-2017 TaxID=2897299 RepID=UPI001F03A02F|nr:PHD finger protein 20-like protein 1 isoform X2 [Xenia sp. Carnegie-2017]